MGFFTELLNTVSPAAMLYNGSKKVNSNDAANEYLNKIPGMAEKNLSPYINPGSKAQSFVDQIMQSYKPSEGYRIQEEELSKQLRGDANKGGFAGNQYHDKQRGKLIQSLLSQDMQQYFNNVNGVHNNSFAASQDLTGIQGGALNQQAELAFGDAENKNARNKQLLDRLYQLLGAGTGVATGGGFGGGNTPPSGMRQFAQNSALGSGMSGGVRPSNSVVPGASFGGGY